MAERKLTDEQVKAVLEAHHVLGYGYGRIRNEIIRRWGVDRAPSLNAIRRIVNGVSYQIPSNLCKKGLHEMTEENTIHQRPNKGRSTWRRRCRACHEKYKEDRK